MFAQPWFFLVLTLFASLLLATANNIINNGLKVELIHPRSPHSPFRNKNLSPLLHSRRNTPQSLVEAYLGQHLMKLYIGTPPFPIYAQADTGSDYVWTQCSPCPSCYRQIDSLFNPSASSTYRSISCSAPQCLDATGYNGCSSNPLCTYNSAYADGSFSCGFLATETFTVNSTTGRPVAVKNITFGCGHNDSASGFNDHTMGLVGLGRGPQSFVSQVGPLLGGRMFSTCLLPFGSSLRLTGAIGFGKTSEVSGTGTVSTPLVSDSHFPTLYTVSLKGFSVGRTFVPFSSSNGEGNMLVDSGTPPIYLPEQFYRRLAVEVKKQVAVKPIEGHPEYGELCYAAKRRASLSWPVLTVHFEGGDVRLMAMHTLIHPPVPGVYCLGINSYNDSDTRGIYGNFAHGNFLVGYDLEKMKLSFKPTDCSKH